MMFFTTSMEPQLLIGWQQETVDVKEDVCRLQEELAEGRAEKHELEARCSALRERVRSVWYGYGAPHIQSNLTSVFLFSFLRMSLPRFYNNWRRTRGFSGSR